ncbi:ROK family transcriptional regulator [Nucisporomicrobium flavum]|uniref:ROK family transcriptional regulator n=1 Tax=Nucisporomicrobium flavum TaxID=2785915 RepID=UPI0027DB9AE1|nr:ROK family transcriptional regulator [Nucisporomicrobium flavum]
MDLVRATTDERVLRTLMEHRRLTRAELAVLIGISKPTAGESVRRLTDAGLIADTGERTAGGRGRGRVGSYYALRQDVGTALAVGIGPEGVIAEAVDAYGEVAARAEQEISRPARPAQVAAAVRTVAADAATRAPAPPRLAVVSAADPVDRATGRLVQLPDAPFLVGELDPVTVLAPYVTGPVAVDNDVNWAAQAERAAANPPLADFAYLYLGEGLGCALVSDGEVRRGATGLAGEIAHLVTTGPQGRAMPLTGVFAELGLHRPGSAAIDVDRLLSAATASPPLREALGRALGGVIAALVALADPAAVVVGGPWGGNEAILDAVRAGFAGGPRKVAIRAAATTALPALTGARLDAASRLRAAIVAAAGAAHAIPS